MLVVGWDFIAFLGNVLQEGPSTGFEKERVAHLAFDEVAVGEVDQFHVIATATDIRCAVAGARDFIEGPVGDQAVGQGAMRDADHRS